MLKAGIALAIGLIAGILLTVMTLNNLRRGSAYPHGVMAVLSAQMERLDQRVKAKQCDQTTLMPYLKTLHQLGNDLEPAFLPTADDARFSTLAGDYRSAVETTLSEPLIDCAAANRSLDAIGATCKACHQEFKN